MVNRRTFTTLFASAAGEPEVSGVQGGDGKLAFVRKYDIEVGNNML
jgi:hypothetical protein